jgi:hypothetical protein
MTRQLIVHEDPDMAETCETALGPEANAIRVSNFEKASRELTSTPDLSLVVLSATAPASSSSRKSTTDCGPARDFIRALKRAAAHRTLPVIALATNHDAELAGLISAFEDSDLLLADSQCLDRLAKRARDLQLDFPRPPSVLELEVTLQDNNNGLYRLSRYGRIEDGRSGALRIDPDVLAELVRCSQELETRAGAGWTALMERVADQLHKLLFHGGLQNTMLWDHFTEMRNTVGGTENVRVFFTPGAQAQTIVFEALRGADKDFWMLKAPITRQYNVAGDQRPLFKDEKSRRGPVNCLILEADADAGDIAEPRWRHSLNALPELDGEAAAVVRILEEARAAGLGVGRVQRLKISREDDDPIQTVLHALDDGTVWHLVHFAGHGVLDAECQPGLVLVARDGGVLPFDALTAKLRRTQLLFVSSCRSAGPAFLMRVVDNVVPAVLGYRWKVHDFGAARFAAAFYEALFNRGAASFKSLEYAILEARKKAYGDRADEITWASPLLVTQMRLGHADQPYFQPLQ